jgi:hypothetical protein
LRLLLQGIHNTSWNLCRHQCLFRILQLFLLCSIHGEKHSTISGSLLAIVWGVDPAYQIHKHKYTNTQTI